MRGASRTGTSSSRQVIRRARTALSLHLRSPTRMLPPARLHRHDDVITYRPYGIDVDPHGRLWEGIGPDLYAPQLDTAAVKKVRLPELGGHVAFQCLATAGKLVV